MNYFFVVGERSGDQHASNVIRNIHVLDPAACVICWGGEMMKEAGATVLTHYREINYMGFWEVAINLRVLLKKIKQCKSDIVRSKPDVVVLVDFAGFNLKIAKFAHNCGLKVAYYISPKVWAWKENRIESIRKYVDRMMVILPFEQLYYKKRNLSVAYVGNPILEQVSSYQWDEYFLSQFKSFRKSVIAVLPGSRTQEVLKSIEMILGLSQELDRCHFLVAAVDNVDGRVYQPLERVGNVTVVWGKTFEVLRGAEAALITSGTATLEAALLNIPQIVVYKTSYLTYWIARFVIKLKYISLVNIIAGRKVVTELIQRDYNISKVRLELDKVLTDDLYKKRISEGYSEIQVLLGNQHASKKAASLVVELGCS